jgi:small subunit ribosomal protein S9
MAEAKKKTTSKEHAAPKKKPAAAKPAAPKKKVAPAAADHVPAAPVAEAPIFKPAVHHAPVVHHAPKAPRQPKIKGPKFYGTGRRKEAIAKVWLAAGSGQIKVNGRTVKDFFCGRRILEYVINQPFVATQTAGKYDVFAETLGGGVPGQAGAVSLGIARALIQMNPDLRTALKKQGLLTRDPRMKERKKYGLKRARRAFQFTKR